jgi:hemerythrin-like metal-binding protein
MSVIKWQSAYEIGIPEIDAQNQKFVEIINKLELAAYSKQAEALVEEVLIDLVDHIRYNFSVEERIMAENQYPDIDRHAEYHLEFAHKVAKLLRKLKENSFLTVRDVLPYLKGWLVGHILREDTKLRVLAASQMIKN